MEDATNQFDKHETCSNPECNSRTFQMGSGQILCLKCGRPIEDPAYCRKVQELASVHLKTGEEYE